MPICFEIQVNAEPPVIAGASDVSVLTACLTLVASRDELELRVGGLAGDSAGGHKFLEWIEREVKTGDRVIFRAVDTAEPDPVASRRLEAPDFAASQERAYYEQLKKKYEPQ